MYRVLKLFHDLEDFTETKGGRIYQKYEEGDIFPRQGFEPSEGRIALLLSSDNAQGVPLIELITEAAEAKTPEEPVEVEEEKPSKKGKKDEE